MEPSPPPPPQGRAPFRLEAVLPVLVVGRDLEPWAEIFHPFCLALPGPKHHQTNRARNFCPPSRTTVAQFRHMAQGPPLHWLRPEEKAVVCSLTAPWSTAPDAPQHSQPSHVLVARLCTTESSRNFSQFAIHSLPAHPYLPFRSGSFNANVTGVQTLVRQDGTNASVNVRPDPKENLFDHACEFLANPFVIHMHAQPRSFFPSMSISMSMPMRRSKQEPRSRRRPRQLGQLPSSCRG